MPPAATDKCDLGLGLGLRPWTGDVILRRCTPFPACCRSSWAVCGDPGSESSAVPADARCASGGAEPPAWAASDAPFKARVRAWR